MVWFWSEMLRLKCALVVLSTPVQAGDVLRTPSHWRKRRHGSAANPRLKAQKVASTFRARSCTWRPTPSSWRVADGRVGSPNEPDDIDVILWSETDLLRSWGSMRLSAAPAEIDLEAIMAILLDRPGVTGIYPFSPGRESEGHCAIPGGYGRRRSGQRYDVVWTAREPGK
jgi:hypothetical protein